MIGMIDNSDMRPPRGRYVKSEGCNTIWCHDHKIKDEDI